MSRQALRILLVENHPDTLEGLEVFFELGGDHVASARDVAGALVAAEREDFDVLISDIGLPDGDGWELMRRLRASGRVGVGIAMSGFGQTKDKQRSLDAGYSVHLVKPFSPDKLETALHELTSSQVKITRPDSTLAS